jgi:hypothetical protein
VPFVPQKEIAKRRVRLIAAAVGLLVVIGAAALLVSALH